jgi:hypothetical protein
MIMLMTLSLIWTPKMSCKLPGCCVASVDCCRMQMHQSFWHSCWQEPLEAWRATE